MECIVNTFLQAITNELNKGNIVKIADFGTFSSYVRHSYVGKGTNGKIEEIPETRYISFKPSKKIK